MTYNPRPNPGFLWAAVGLCILACIIIGGQADASTGGTQYTSGMGWSYAPDYVTVVKPGGIAKLPSCTTEVDVRAPNQPQRRIRQDYLGVFTSQGKAFGWVSRGRSVNVVWLTGWDEVYGYGSRAAIVAAWCG